MRKQHARFWILTTSLIVLMVAPVLVLPVGAAPNLNERAKPKVTNFNEIEGDLSELFTDVCGFPVNVDTEGWFKEIEIDAADRGKRQPVLRTIYHITSEVFTSEWGTFKIRQDVGPDVVFVENGEFKAAVTGRSLTGSGVIGRVVYDLATGEIESEAGRRVYEDFFATVCEALAPPED